MRLVLDTSILIAAIRSNAGASNRLLEYALGRRFTMLGSVPLFMEYEAVVMRPEHLAAAGLTAAEAGVLLDALASVSVPVRMWFIWRPVSRDADDEMVVETAINGRADAVVTFNRADFAGSERFGIRTLSPAEALREIGGTS